MSSKKKGERQQAAGGGRSVLLALILLLAAALRLYDLAGVPLGMNVDEAANAWNAWTLAKEGRDQHGVRWPLLDSEGFGQGMSTLFLYTLLPFEALLGPGAFAVRLPGAIAGVITVALLASIGRRLFDYRVGLAAAALLAVLPWHLQLSRWGHMATIFPFAVAAVIAAMLWARLPVADHDEEPSPQRAIIAGALAGLSIYGYYAIRLWMPIFLTAVALATAGSWLRAMRTSRGRAAVGLFAVTAAIVASPIVVGTLTNPLLQKRAALTWVWESSDSFATRVGKVLARYPEHFGFDFLFRRGDPDLAYSPPIGYGVALWVMAPLLLAGIITLVIRFRASAAARMTLAFLVLYPAADLLNEHPTAHALRSAPGSIALVLVAALGAIAAFDALRSRSRSAAVALSGVVLLCVVVNAAGSTSAYFREFDRNVEKYHAYSGDLHTALKWVEPRFTQYDAIIVTGYGMSHPYVHTLVGLEYRPQAWFTDGKVFVRGPLPNGAYRDEEICLRFGKVSFLFEGVGNSIIDDLRANGRPDSVLMLIRPGELGGLSLSPPQYRVKNPAGAEVLWLVETRL